MKKIKFFALLTITAMLAACGNPKGEKAETGEAQDVQDVAEATTYTVNTENSNLEWLGTKPTGEHFGKVMLKDGSLEMKDGNIVGGNFTVDLSTISVDDIEDEEMNMKLKGHLLSSDFFDVDSFPTASFEITSVEAIENFDGELEEGQEVPTHKITGNLTMKDVTKSITFHSAVNITENEISASSPQFLLDRTEWNVQYGSKKLFPDLKDKFIHDEMGLKINLVASK
jgi:polyisoprenoid-binding protein YceI